MRWNHPRQGAIPPTQFIPAAEHTGVIRPLTLYVLRNALGQCKAWRDAGLDLGISVNLSARNLFDVHLVEDIGAIIEEIGVPASALTLELTESTVMSESRRSIDVLLGIQDLGVALSVDDFGTGYSSLAHLRSLPVSELKIDRSFVATMTVNEHDAMIVRTLVELGTQPRAADGGRGRRVERGVRHARRVRLRRGAGLPAQPAAPGGAVRGLGRAPAGRAASTDATWSAARPAATRRIVGRTR